MARLRFARWVRAGGIALALGANSAVAAAATAAPVSVASPAAGEAAAHSDWLNEAAQTPAPIKRGAPLLLSISVTALSFAALMVRWTLKRRGLLQANGAKPSELTILAQQSLGGAHQLVIVEACGERLLIGRSADELTLLSHLPAADEPPTAAADGEHQAQGLARARAEAEAPVAAQAAPPAQPAPVAVAIPAAPPPARPREEPWPADLRGLHRWREQPTAPAQTRARAGGEGRA